MRAHPQRRAVLTPSSRCCFFLGNPFRPPSRPQISTTFGNSARRRVLAFFADSNAQKNVVQFHKQFDAYEREMLQGAGIIFHVVGVCRVFSLVSVGVVFLGFGRTFFNSETKDLFLEFLKVETIAKCH